MPSHHLPPPGKSRSADPVRASSDLGYCPRGIGPSCGRSRAAAFWGESEYAPVCAAERKDRTRHRKTAGRGGAKPLSVLQ